MYFCAFYQDEIGVAMNYFNRFLLKTMCLITIFSFVFFVGCKNDIVDDPIEENPQTDVPETTDPSENVKFINNTDFVVKIFTDEWYFNLLGEVYPDEEFSCYICPAEQGNVFYYTYYFLVEGVQIPYGEFCGYYDLVQKHFFSIDIQNPTELFTNSKNIVILKNNSNSTVHLDYGSSELIPENKKIVLQKPNGLINPTEHGVYILSNINNSTDKNTIKYQINTVTDITDLSLDEEKGFIYSFVYTGTESNKLVLSSKTSLNQSIKNKVWKNSLSKTYGKDLVAGCIAPREIKEDGYMLFGSLSASSINDAIEGNVPYYAFMNTNGEVTKEYSLNFRDSPKSTVFYHCIEKNGIWLAVGKNRYEDNSESLFVVGELNGRSFYQKIPSYSENSEQEQLDTSVDNSNYKSCGITHVKDNTFCVLLGYEDDEKGSKVGGFDLLEVTIDSSNEVKNTIVYKTSEEVIPCSVLYNNGKYIVLSQNTSLEESTISVIEKNSDTFECNKNGRLDSFSLNKMKIDSILEKSTSSNDSSKSENVTSIEYLFLSGSYVDVISGRDIATFGKIKIDDINNLDIVDTSNFKMFTGSNNSLNSNFDDFVVDEKKENIILGGFSCADYDYQHRSQYGIVTKNAVPFIVSYNLNQNKTNWENEYTDQKGYVVYSVEKSSIDSLFMDLWNPSTRHSYIVSTGLLGEIPEKIKYTLGQDSSIKEVKGAEITVKFYENSNSQTAYAQDVFQLGKEYTFEDFKKYEPGDVCEVTGWYVLGEINNNSTNKNFSMFNTAINTISRLVAILGTSSVPNDKIEDTSAEDDTIVKGEELTFPVKFTDYNITEINLYPKYECSIHYDENYHWNVCTCGKKTENKTKHIFSNWKKLNGKDIKKCSSCDFTITADENTHIIYSVYDLLNIEYNNTTSAIFELANDIDGGGQTWTPIDTFYGTLIGNGFSIKNFIINEESSLDNETAYCGFFYKNRGTIKNIFFKNITVDAYFEYFTSDWRKVTVGTVTGLNSGTIKNVHMENIQISSVLNHQKDKEKTPHQLNVVGGIVGVNKGIISYCSIKNSEISVSTSAKKNRCDTSSYAGGICGDVQNVIDNVLVVATIVSTHSEGGFMDGWFTGDDLDDGILKSYAGNVFGTVNSNNVSKVVSYNNSDAIATTYNISYNPTSYKNSDKIAGINKEKVSSKYSFQAIDLNSYSSTINSWDGWSVTDNSIENYLEFN